jgi:hypothetical protein
MENYLDYEETSKGGAFVGNLQALKGVEKALLPKLPRKLFPIHD